MEFPATKEKVANLQKDLVALLPQNEQTQKDALQEAAWLSNTAVEQSVEIARANDPLFIGWMNNILVNSKFRDRGLCWQYQHDLYRELRRKPLKYFALGATVRDQGRGREHNCVYVCAKGRALSDSIVLDPWAKCGNLKLIYPEDREKNWEESPNLQNILQSYFPEGHKYDRSVHIIFVEYDGQTYARLTR